MYLGSKSSQEAVCFALEGLGTCHLLTIFSPSSPGMQLAVWMLPQRQSFAGAEGNPDVILVYFHRTASQQQLGIDMFLTN